MSQIIDTLLSDLHALITDLGKDGGLISPSVYDTAQVLRFCPPKEGVELAFEWILEQQQPDGGWGNPAVPLSRHMPTLASVLALQTYSQIKPQEIEVRVQAGIEFLLKHANEWQNAHIDDYPIAVEVVFPKLLEDAKALGIVLPNEPYTELVRLGNKKRQQIAKMKPIAGTAPTYSWEAWGTDPTTDVVDAIGSVGTSPAATAAWIHAAEKNPDLANTCELARDYLKKAMSATSIGIPGVVPTVWPINYFDLHYGLYTLFVSGLLEHPTLQKVVQLQAQNLADALQPTGINYCPYFQPDADCTAVALIALHAKGYSIDIATMLSQFKHRGSFMTYPNELNPSVLTNAHALHALAYTNKNTIDYQNFLMGRQFKDGRWLADKWHSSWLYTTLEVVLTLTQFGKSKGLQSTLNIILSHQHIDGGWGINNQSTVPETSYGVLILYTLQKYIFFDKQAQKALIKGHQWLLNHYYPFTVNEDKLWIGKELYSPYRVDRAFELSAMLAIAMEKAL